MANASHGKKTRVWFETTPGGGTKPPALAPVGFTQFQKAYSMSRQGSKDLASSDSFGSEEHTNEPGLKGGTTTFEFRYNGADYAVLLAAYNSETPVCVIFRPEGNVAGKYQFWADYHIEALDITSSVGDVVNASISLRRNGEEQYAAIA